VTVATTYERIYADEDGESHFATVEVSFREVDYAPPADPMNVSELVGATRTGFVMAAPGPLGDWHPTPVRQYMIPVSGDFEVTVSDGSKRRFGPGQPLLMEDQAGKGHYTEVVSDEPGVVAVIQLPD
jgi:hypothetical protein